MTTSTTPASPRLRQFYKTSDAYLAGLLARTPEQFATFCALVLRLNPPGGTILEIGAGATQAASRLAAESVRVVAMDLSHLFLSAAPHDGKLQPKFVVGDAIALPFLAESFNVVCLHDVIEHIEDQDLLWAEVTRAVRGGGHIVVVGPNLLSPINPMLIFFRELKARRLQLDCGKQAFKNATVTVRKLYGLDQPPRYRNVVVYEGMHSDQDASYLASPVDVRRFLERHGCRIIRYQRDGRTRLGRVLKTLVGSFAPSIWIVALKEQGRRHA